MQRLCQSHSQGLDQGIMLSDQLTSCFQGISGDLPGFLERSSPFSSRADRQVLQLTLNGSAGLLLGRTYCLLGSFLLLRKAYLNLGRGERYKELVWIKLTTNLRRKRYQCAHYSKNFACCKTESICDKESGSGALWRETPHRAPPKAIPAKALPLPPRKRGKAGFLDGN